MGVVFVGMVDVVVVVVVIVISESTDATNYAKLLFNIFKNIWNIMDKFSGWWLVVGGLCLWLGTVFVVMVFVVVVVVHSIPDPLANVEIYI